MKERIRGYHRRSVVTFFGVFYLLTLFFAMYPPLYLWRSSIRFEIFGVPFATMYWLADALVLALGLAAFCKVAELRGELDDDLLKPPARSGADRADLAIYWVCSEPGQCSQEVWRVDQVLGECEVAANRNTGCTSDRGEEKSSRFALIDGDVSATRGSRRVVQPSSASLSRRHPLRVAGKR